MSQDLFAAFTIPEQAEAESNPLPAASRVPSQYAPHSTLIDGGAAGTVNVDEDDDFGDFEDASKPTAPGEPFGSGHPATTSSSQQLHSKAHEEPPKSTRKDPHVRRHPFAGNMDILFAADDDEYDAGADEIADLASNPEAAMAYSKRVIAEQNAAQQHRASTDCPSTSNTSPSEVSMGLKKKSGNARSSNGESSQQARPNKLKKKSGYAPPPKDPDILFDAENMSEVEEDDDFGDFEVGSSTMSKLVAQPGQKTTQSIVPATNLLDLNDKSADFATVSSSASVTKAGMNAQGAKISTTATSGAPRIPADDEWDDFEAVDAPGSVPLQPSNALKTTISPLEQPPARVVVKDTDQLPPINIPPPAILLSIFPSLFASAHDALFNPLAKLDLKQKQVLLAHPATHMFLKGYITLAIVLGHIIAGRKLRWKRDQFLAQGMRIGPAAAGGKGGMKLTGLDKGEVAKEDREVLDTVTMWKDHVGRLRTAISTASSGLGTARLPQVPEIAEQMPVRSLKATEGGITAPHPCALCGLKREERVAKVDVRVEDSFGEWWVEGMSMHVVCRNFWEEQKGKLKSR